MKTLKELNSKWYWRLIKVIYSLMLAITITGAVVLCFIELGAYNPNYINNVISKTESYDERFGKMRTYVAGLNGIYSSGNLWGYASGGILKPSILYYILATEKNASIEGVTLVCMGKLKSECYAEVPDDYSYWSYTRGGSIVSVPEYLVNGISDMINELSNLLSSIKNYKKNGDPYYMIINYNNFFGEDISTEQNYYGIFEYIKIFLSSIGVILGAWIFTYIIKGILYYILFGTAFPKE